MTEEAGATNGDVENTTCTDRWKAAVANILKWIWKSQKFSLQSVVTGSIGYDSQ